MLPTGLTTIDRIANLVACQSGSVVGVVIMGSDGTNAYPLRTDSLGALNFTGTVTVSAYKILAESEVTIVSSGSAVALPSNTSAKAVQVFNNSGAFAVVGLSATVSAVSDPMVGQVLPPTASTSPIGVTVNSNEIYVAADTSGTKVTVHILG